MFVNNQSLVQIAIAEVNLTEFFFRKFKRFTITSQYSFNRHVYMYMDNVFLSWCPNIWDIHGIFNELLDPLIDPRAYDCYVLVYFSHLSKEPVTPRQNKPAHDKTNKFQYLTI